MTGCQICKRQGDRPHTSNATVTQMCPEAANRKRRRDRLLRRRRYATDALWAARKTYQNRVRRRAAATAADQERLRRLGA